MMKAVWKKLGNVGVDSGEIVVCDPCQCFADEMDAGLVVRARTYMGDGLYPVFGLFDGERGDRPMAMLIWTGEARKSVPPLPPEIAEG
jgi:hypothetical protein